MTDQLLIFRWLLLSTGGSAVGEREEERPMRRGRKPGSSPPERGSDLAYRRIDRLLAPRRKGTPRHAHIRPQSSPLHHHRSLAIFPEPGQPDRLVGSLVHLPV